MDGTINWPKGIFSKEAKSLISALLDQDAATRLGAGPSGWRDVMGHPFFARIDWGLVGGGGREKGTGTACFHRHLIKTPRAALIP